MIDIKPYIEYLKTENIKREDGLELLKNDKKLQAEEKNLIYAYCYPRLLGDRELPSRVQAYRGTKGNIPGWLSTDLGEVTLILEAGQTEQYGRFIKHIMHAFGDPSLIYPIDGEETHECAICGKTIYENKIWLENFKETEEKEKREYLAYGSTESGITLCSDCLVQLLSAKEIIENLDPSFLDWTKRVKKNWNDFGIH